VIAALAVATVLAPAAAHAERWAGGDPRGDVQGWHFDPEPQPCGTTSEIDATQNTNSDLTGLVVRHNRTAVRLSLRFRDLDPALEQATMIHIATTARRGWFLIIDRFRGRSGNFRVVSYLAKEPNYPDPEDLGDGCGNFGFFVTSSPCRIRPEIDLDADVVTATVRRSCLGNPRWVRVGVDAFGWVDPEDPHDKSFISYSDEWGVRDDSASPWLPPFGPKVRAPSRSRPATPAESLAEPRRHRFVISDGRVQPEGWFRNQR
jgi:hypothetical protein